MTSNAAKLEERDEKILEKKKIEMLILEHQDKLDSQDFNKNNRP